MGGVRWGWEVGGALIIVALCILCAISDTCVMSGLSSGLGLMQAATN